MFVMDWMTRDVVTAGPDEDIADAINRMRKFRIRRLPVEQDGALAGIVTQTDLLRLLPHDFNPLKKEGAACPTCGIKVAEAMQRDVIAAQPHQAIEDVALTMREKRIGAMPVVARGRLVGIITESDLFGALARSLGAGEGGVRIAFELPDDPNALVRICQTMRTFAIKVHSLSMFHTGGDRREDFTLRVEGADVDRFVKALWGLGCRVVGVKHE